MAIDPHGLLAAALSVRVTADTTGLDAEIASNLTAAERRALLTSERVSAATGRVTEAGVASSAKLQASTLRQTAAQESYNRLLRSGETDTVRLARAQASLITAQAGVRREQTRLTESTAATAVKGEVATAGILGSTRTLLGAAAGIGIFTALKRGVSTYEQLTGSVRSYQRATQDSAQSSSEMVALLNRFNISGEVGVTSMTRFGRIISETPDKLHKYGVEIARNSDGTTNLTKTLLNAGTALQGIHDPATRSALVMDLFGRAGARLLPILMANKDSLKEFIDQAARSGQIFSQEDLDRARRLAMSQKDLTQAWQGFEIVLARGVIPVLHDVDRVGTQVLNLFTEHRTIGTAVLRIGEVAAGLYAINKAIKTFDAIRNSTLFSKVLNVRETQAQAAANLELAGSYSAVGAAAASSAPEVAALGVAEATTGGRALTGAEATAASLQASARRSAAKPGRVNAFLGSGLGAAAVFTADLVLVPKAISSLHTLYDEEGAAQLAGKVKKLVEGSNYVSTETHQAVSALIPQVNAAFQAAQRGQYGPLQAVYGALQQAYTNPKRALASTPQALAQQQQVVAQQQLNRQAVSASRATGRQYADSIDIFSRAASLTPHADPGAAAALDNARSRAADAARRVTLDEQRLNALRANSKTSALTLAGAEETLRLAKERSAKASEDVQAAEKKTHAERLPTARGLLATATSQANRAALDAKAVERLYGVGVRSDVVAKIVAENVNKPGALESIARTETPKLARALNHEFHRIVIDGSIIAGTPKQWETAGEKRALDFMRGVQNEFNQAAPAVIRARIAGVRRKNDSQTPVTSPSRTRQRALSGTQTSPFGP